MELFVNGVKYGDCSVFIVSKEIKIYGNMMYVYVILDLSKKVKDMSNILKNNLNNE